MSPVSHVGAAAVEVEKGLEMPGNARECQTAPGVRMALLNLGAKLQQNLFSSFRQDLPGMLKDGGKGRV